MIGGEELPRYMSCPDVESAWKAVLTFQDKANRIVREDESAHKGRAAALRDMVKHNSWIGHNTETFFRQASGRYLGLN